MVKSRWSFVVLVLLLAVAGCTRHVKPEKFEVSYDQIPAFTGRSGVAIFVPAEAEKEYLVQFTSDRPSAKVYVDLNDMYRITRELIEDVLAKRQVSFAPESARQIRFTIDRMQWEVWAGGFSIGAYMDFTVETSSGYRQAFKVQDGSAVDVTRSIGGLPSRAVETIFSDPQIIAFLQAEPG